MFTNSFAYPNLFNPTSGLCRTVADYESIVNRVGCLLKSYIGEEFMFPEFGCTFPDILFRYNDQQRIQVAKKAIIDGITKFEPFVNENMIQIIDESDVNVLRLSVTLVLDKDYRQLAGTVEWSFNQEGVSL